jgi:hypothetical protein
MALALWSILWSQSVPLTPRTSLIGKPMKDHNLPQAICRVKRTYGQTKTHGLIVDYIGIFDDVAQALDLDEKAVQQVVSNIEELRNALPVHMQKCPEVFSAGGSQRWRLRRPHGRAAMPAQ